MLPITELVKEIIEGGKKLPTQEDLIERVVRIIKKEPCSEPRFRSLVIGYSCVNAQPDDLNRILRTYEKEGFVVIPTIFAERRKYRLYGKHLMVYSPFRMLQTEVKGKEGEYIYSFEHRESTLFLIHNHFLYISTSQLLTLEGKKKAIIKLKPEFKARDVATKLGIV